MAETRTITGIPGIKPSVLIGDEADWRKVVRSRAAADRAADMAGRRGNYWRPEGDRGDVSLENISKLLKTLGMQGARRHGITDITAQESGAGFSPIQRHVRDYGPEPTADDFSISHPLDQGRAQRALAIARDTPRDTLYQKYVGNEAQHRYGMSRGTQGFGLGLKGPGGIYGTPYERAGEEDHSKALARKLLEGRSVNRGDPADVLRRYGGGLRRDDPAPVNYRRQAPTFDRFNR